MRGLRNKATLLFKVCWVPGLSRFQAILHGRQWSFSFAGSDRMVILNLLLWRFLKRYLQMILWSFLCNLIKITAALCWTITGYFTLLRSIKCQHEHNWSWGLQASWLTLPVASGKCGNHSVHWFLHNLHELWADYCIYISTTTVRSWWSQWRVMAANYCYSWWRWWPDALWFTLTTLWLHLFSFLFWAQ